MTQGESDLKILESIQSLRTLWEMSLKGNMLHNRRDFKSELWDKYI